MSRVTLHYGIVFLVYIQLEHDVILHDGATSYDRELTTETARIKNKNKTADGHTPAPLRGAGC